MHAVIPGAEPDPHALPYKGQQQRRAGQCRQPARFQPQLEVIVVGMVDVQRPEHQAVDVLERVKERARSGTGRCEGRRGLAAGHIHLPASIQQRIGRELQHDEIQTELDRQHQTDGHGREQPVLGALVLVGGDDGRQHQQTAEHAQHQAGTRTREHEADDEHQRHARHQHEPQRMAVRTVAPVEAPDQTGPHQRQRGRHGDGVMVVVGE